MSILNPTTQEIADDKASTYREYWNPPKTTITNPTIEELHNDLNDLIKLKQEQSRVAKTASDERRGLEHFKQKTFIVAGNYTEYHDWLRRKGYSEQEYKYVMGAETLKGISAENLKGIFIGTWKNRSDINEIKNQIAVIKSKLSNGTIVSGLSGTTVYYDGQNYPISGTLVSSGGSGAASTFGSNGVFSSGGAGSAATYGTYDITTETTSSVELIVRAQVRAIIRDELRNKLQHEIEELGYGDATRDPILVAIDRVLDKY